MDATARPLAIAAPLPAPRSHHTTNVMYPAYNELQCSGRSSRLLDGRRE